MPKTKLTARTIAQRVRPYVKKILIGDITLVVDDKRISLHNGYWRIPVRPSREPEPLFPYFEALANLEGELQAKEHIKVTIASGDPVGQ